jgi:hypothetical protein
MLNPVKVRGLAVVIAPPSKGKHMFDRCNERGSGFSILPISAKVYSLIERLLYMTFYTYQPHGGLP